VKSRRLNILDKAIILVVAICLSGFVLARKGLAGVNQEIDGSPKVEIQVFITGLKTKDVDLFKVGDKSSITIRNNPVTPPMTIVKVEHQQKQIDQRKAQRQAKPGQRFLSLACHGSRG